MISEASGDENEPVEIEITRTLPPLPPSKRKAPDGDVNNQKTKRARKTFTHFYLNGEGKIVASAAQPELATDVDVSCLGKQMEAGIGLFTVKTPVGPVTYVVHKNKVRMVGAGAAGSAPSDDNPSGIVYTQDGPRLGAAFNAGMHHTAKMVWQELASAAAAAAGVRLLFKPQVEPGLAGLSLGYIYSGQLVPSLCLMRDQSRDSTAHLARYLLALQPTIWNDAAASRYGVAFAYGNAAIDVVSLEMLATGRKQSVATLADLRSGLASAKLCPMNIDVPALAAERMRDAQAELPLARVVFGQTRLDAIVPATPDNLPLILGRSGLTANGLPCAMGFKVQ